MPGIEPEKQQRNARNDAEQHIAENPEPGKPAAQGAQIVIKQAQRKSQQSGARKGQRLRGNRQLHQPNSLAKKPPAGASSS